MAAWAAANSDLVLRLGSRAFFFEIRSLVLVETSRDCGFPLCFWGSEALAAARAALC